MFLVIHNLPADIRYEDIKSLIQTKCGLSEVILDNLVSEGRNKKVTVGLADESDAAILVRKINGLFILGQQLYVENAKLKKALEQPYRSSKSFQKPIKDMYPDSIESSSVINNAYGQEQPSNTAMYSANEQSLYNPSQGLYNPNGQVLWDQAAMMSPMGGGMSAMSHMGVGGVMYVPSMNPSTPFVEYGSQSRSQADIPRQVVDPPAPRRHIPQGDDREWGAGYGKAQRNDPISQFDNDMPRRRDDNPRRNFDPNMRWDDSTHVSRWDEPAAPVSSQLAQADRWSDDRLNTRDRYEYPNEPQPAYGQPRREPFVPKPFGDSLKREFNAFGDYKGNSDYRSEARAIDPWEESAQGVRKYDEREPPSPSKFGRNESQRFDRPLQPWQQGDSMDIQRPSRQNLRFDDEIKPLFSKGRVFDRPEPFRPEPFAAPFNPSRPEAKKPFSDRPERFASRFNQPRPDVKKPVPRDQQPGGAKKRPLDSQGPHGISPFERPHGKAPFARPQGKAPFAPKPFSRDEPPNKRFASSTGPGGSPRSSQTRPGGRPGGQSRPDGQPPRPGQPRPAGQPRPIAQPRPGQGQPRPVGQTRPGNAADKPNYTNMFARLLTWCGQAAADIAKDMLKNLGLPRKPPRDPIMVALKTSIRARIDILIANKKPQQMADIINIYRQNFNESSDQEFYKAVADSVAEEEKVNGDSEPKPAGTKPDAGKPQGNAATPATKPGAKPATKPGAKPATKPGAKPATKPGAKPVGTSPGAKKVPQKPGAAATTTKRDPNKLPPHPYGDKKISRSQKMELKQEMKEDPYELEPIQQKALDEYVDELCDVYMGECDGETDEQKRKVCERIADHTSDEFRKVLRLQLKKRILNVKNALMIRVIFTHKPPQKDILMAFLKRYGAISMKRSPKKKMYIINVDSYEHYDALCLKESTELGGEVIKFKPLHVAGPVDKTNRKAALQQRIACQIDKGAFLDKVEFPAEIQCKLQKGQANKEIASAPKAKAAVETAVKNETEVNNETAVEIEPETALEDDETNAAESSEYDIDNMQFKEDEQYENENGKMINLDEAYKEFEDQIASNAADDIPDVDNIDEDDLEEW